MRMKTSRAIQKKREELQAREAEIWKDLKGSTEGIHKNVNVNLKRIGIAVAGSIAGYFLYKTISGGFAKDKANSRSAKNSVVSKATATFVFHMLKNAIPTILEKIKTKRQTSEDKT